MFLKLNRYSRNENANIGCLSVDGVAKYQTIEDPSRDIKIAGKTCIPAGSYEVKFREVLSGKTKHYRSKFEDWFTWHLELQDVPNFEYVYIHIGNSTKDTEGCILVAESANLKTNTIHNSTYAFKELYLDASKALNDGEKVFIEIVDL